ncbi:MAG: hypothetical protein M1457_07835 [bacterium]|nr:hypothetical protein [bacterium]
MAGAIQRGGIHLTTLEYTFPSGPPDYDIDAPEAWAVTMGDPDLIIAVPDTGVGLTHRETEGRLWTNAAEAAGTPGVDDDGNGIVDDLHGADFCTLGRAPDAGTPSDDGGHGTGAASTNDTGEARVFPYPANPPAESRGQGRAG